MTKKRIKSRRTGTLLAIIAIMFLQTSCFTLKEKLELNPNGSGQLTITIDLNFFRMFESERTSTDWIAAELLQKSKEVENLDGISKVSLLKEDFLYGLSLKFKDLNALNMALNHLYESANAQHKYFSMEAGLIQRKHTQGHWWKSHMADLDKKENGRKFLDAIKYEIDISLKDQVKVVYAVGGVEYQGDKMRGVVITQSGKRIVEDPASLDLTLVID